MASESYVTSQRPKVGRPLVASTDLEPHTSFGVMIMRTTMAALSLLVLAGCGTNTPTASPTTEATEAPPKPNYSEERNGIYYYVTGVSENEKAEGKSVGDILAYRYLGKNKAGEHEIGILDSDESLSVTASCPQDCRIIRASTGDKMPYNTNSVLGAVFEDAIAGRLKASKAK
jgi:hypothetical protein